jgi:formylglycine-generating enzyme required for sulfatase activity
MISPRSQTRTLSSVPACKESVKSDIEASPPPASGRLRVARGGGWYGTSACSRAGFNDTWEPDDPRHPDFRRFQGFRVIRSLP